MKATWLNVGAGLLALIWMESAGATLISETFDSAASAASHGWTSFNNGVSGNVVGVTNSTLAGGVSPGEAQLDFRRSTSRVYYADTDLDGTLNSALALSFAGKLDALSITNTADFGAGVLIAFFNTANSAYVGLVFNDSGPNLTWGLRIISSSGSAIVATGLDGSRAFGVNVDRTFSMSYDPFANGGNGALTGAVSGAGSPITVNLTAGQRASFNALTFNAFGFDKPVASFDPTTRGANFRVDDVIYTVVPEPSTMLLLGTGGWLIVRRRSVGQRARWGRTVLHLPV